MAEISLIHPIGFCAGVRRAVQMFRQILEEHPGKTIYVLHELVHNRSVSTKMEAEGARFVQNLQQVPDGAVMLLGAHGCGLDVEEQCKAKHLITYDAVCPLVQRLQQTAATCHPSVPLILLGDSEHPEVKSVVNRAQHRATYVIQRGDTPLPPMEQALFLSQTTRNAAEVQQVGKELEQRIPCLINQAQVCDAVLLRQQAVRQLAQTCDLMLVIGSPHSSNARRLLDIACSGTTAYMVETVRDIQPQWLQGVRHIGIAAGTSTPDWDIEQIQEKLKGL